MLRAVDVTSALAGLTPLQNRSAATPADQVKAAFAVLAPFRDGSVFAGRFSGETAWERHAGGDELVQVLDGAATLVVMTGEGPQSLALSAGILAVVTGGPLMDMINVALGRGAGPRASFLLAVVFFALGALLLRPVVEPRRRVPSVAPVPADAVT